MPASLPPGSRFPTAACADTQQASAVVYQSWNTMLLDSSKQTDTAQTHTLNARTCTPMAVFHERQPLCFQLPNLTLQQHLPEYDQNPHHRSCRCRPHHRHRHGQSDQPTKANAEPDLEDAVLQASGGELEVDHGADMSELRVEAGAREPRAHEEPELGVHFDAQPSDVDHGCALLDVRCPRDERCELAPQSAERAVDRQRSAGTETLYHNIH
eukprot:3501021-Rhodomonas_salina.2